MCEIECKELILCVRDEDFLVALVLNENFGITNLILGYFDYDDSSRSFNFKKNKKIETSSVQN